jgi:hypothetical protein
MGLIERVESDAEAMARRRSTALRVKTLLAFWFVGSCLILTILFLTEFAAVVTAIFFLILPSWVIGRLALEEFRERLEKREGEKSGRFETASRNEEKP